MAARTTDTKGVAFTPPPPERIGVISQALDDAFTYLPPDAKGAIVGVGNETGMNAVLVLRGAHGWDVQAWVGKTWKGSMEYGAAVRKWF